MSEIKLKKLEDKLRVHEERVNKIKREEEEKKIESIMDLFKKMNADKEDCKVSISIFP